MDFKLTYKQFIIAGCLLILLCSVSFGGVLFALIDYNSNVVVGPILQSCWRMTSTSMFQFFPFLYQLNKTTKAVRTRYVSLSSIFILLIAGLFLAIHFATWVWSIQLTSLAHSLLFVSCGPIIIVLFLGAVRLLSFSPLCQKIFSNITRFPNIIEAIGTIVGFGGAAIVCLDSRSDKTVSLFGDFIAFIGAVAVCVYLASGQMLRSWMPTFMYAFPINLSAALFLAIAALIFEGASFTGAANVNIFGWFLNDKYAYLSVLLAIIPGLLGHTLINYILKEVSAFTVSILILFEPLVGSVFGYIFHVQGSPGLYTFIGGPIMIFGAGIVTYGSSKETKPEKGDKIDTKNDKEKEGDMKENNLLIRKEEEVEITISNEKDGVIQMRETIEIERDVIIKEEATMMIDKSKDSDGL